MAVSTPVTPEYKTLKIGQTVYKNGGTQAYTFLGTEGAFVIIKNNSNQALEYLADTSTLFQNPAV